MVTPGESGRAHVPEDRLSTARPSFTPPVDPGRLTTSVAPGHPGQATRQRRGRDALADRRRRGSPRRCPGPRGRAPAGSSRASGRSASSPVPPVVTTTSRRRRSTARRQRLRAPAHRRARPRLSDLAEARLLSRALRRSAGPWCPRRPRPPPGWRPTDHVCAVPSPSQSRSRLEPGSDGPVAAAATGLARAPDVADHRGLVDGLDHVDRRRGRPPTPRSAPPSRRRCGRPSRTVAVISTASSATSRSTSTPLSANGMAQRDQVGCALGGHDPGDPGHPERVTLRHALAAEQARRPRPRPSTRPRGDRLARRHVLAGHVDHARGTRLVDVSERRLRRSGRSSRTSEVPVEHQDVDGRPRRRPTSSSRATTIRRWTAPGRRSGASRGRRPASPARPAP